ncbi:MAG TPA: hypothetical protein VIV11_22550 [Kofleriaceae bacterium]
MNKLIVILILGLSAVAAAQPGSAAQPPQPGSAAQPAPPADQPPPPPAPNDARAACSAAMNADPAFAKSIIATVDAKSDAKILEMHQQAAGQVAENQRHVIYAYAAMWILAAGFVAFMWWRQQALKAELAQLRRDLDAAAKDSK